MDPFLERAKAAVLCRVGEAFRPDMDLAELAFRWDAAENGALVLTVQRGSWQRRLLFLEVDVVTCLAELRSLGKYVVAIQDLAAWFLRTKKADADPHAPSPGT